MTFIEYLSSHYFLTHHTEDDQSISAVLRPVGKQYLGISFTAAVPWGKLHSVLLQLASHTTHTTTTTTVQQPPPGVGGVYGGSRL